MACDAVVCLMRHFLELSHMQRGIWDGSSIVCVTLAAGFTAQPKNVRAGSNSQQLLHPNALKARSL